MILTAQSKFNWINKKIFNNSQILGFENLSRVDITCSAITHTTIAMQNCIHIQWRSNRCTSIEASRRRWTRIWVGSASKKSGYGF